MRSVEAVLRVALVGLLVALAGCAANPITGRSQLLLVSEEQAIGSSASAYTSMIGQFSKRGKIETGSERANRLRTITNRLVAQAVRFRPDSANWAWEVQLINDPKVVNAFCMAGGKMAFYSGFWDKLKATDDEVAAVMGHEIAHALASHTREKMSEAIAVGLGSAVVAAGIASRSNSVSYRDTLIGVELAAALAITLPNSREAETEADRIGIELAARAGYDPRASVTLWQKMAKEGGAPPEFLSTHPAPTTRIIDMRAMVPRVDKYYQQARASRTNEQIPMFLARSGAANERPVGTVSREAFARRAESEPDAMSFLAERLEAYRRGETVLECRVACLSSYNLRKEEWAGLHKSKTWRQLALSVLSVGYLSDLSYYLLAEAARGMGLPEAARTYYRRALDAGKEYGCGGAIDTCEGFDVPKLAAAALRAK